MNENYNIKNLEKMIIEKSCKNGLLEFKINEQSLEILKLKNFLGKLVYEKLEIKSTDETLNKLNKIYTRLLRREIDLEGLLFFYPKIKNNEMSFDDLENNIKNSQEFIIVEKTPRSIKTG